MECSDTAIKKKKTSALWGTATKDTTGIPRSLNQSVRAERNPNHLLFDF